MAERSNAEWIDLLAVGDESALAELRKILCRCLARVLSGRADASAAEDFAQEAVLRVLARLSSFRGDSKFLTWAIAVATRVAFSELRKAEYRHLSLEAVKEDIPNFDPIASPSASQQQQRETLEVLRRLIETELTDKQQVVILGELSGVPQAVLAERMGTNRNALYKLGHDARKNLRKALLAAGVSAEDLSMTFPASS